MKDYKICKRIYLVQLGATCLAFIYDAHIGSIDASLSDNQKRYLKERMNLIKNDFKTSEDKLAYRSVMSMILNMDLTQPKMHTVPYTQQNIDILTSEAQKQKFMAILSKVGFYDFVRVAINRHNIFRQRMVEQEQAAIKRYTEYNLEKYTLAKQLKTKEQLQDFYARLVRRITNKGCDFDKASNLDHYSEVGRDMSGTFKRYTGISISNLPDNYIQLISRPSKEADFLEMIYAIEYGRGLLDTSADKDEYYDYIGKYEHNALKIVMYKLGVIRKEDLKYVNSLSEKAATDIRDLEQLLQLK